MNFQSGAVTLDPSEHLGSQRRSRIEETVVCTRAGDMLFDAAPENVQARIGWLRSVEDQSYNLGRVFALGEFDRLETDLAEGRAISLVRGGKLVFVRVTTTLGAGK